MAPAGRKDPVTEGLNASGWTRQEAAVRRVLHGRLLATGEPTRLVVDRATITRIEPATDEELAEANAGDLWLGAGLVDIQVNGYAGHDLNSEAPSAEAVGEVSQALRQAGVTRFCPTVVTGPLELMEARLQAIAQAVRLWPDVAEAVICVHLEGPFLSPEDGPRGAHPAAHILPASGAAFERLQAAAEGRIGIVTLAPEVPGALDLARGLASAGIIVAIGHTGASRETIRAAVRAGARLSTHLGNGAHAVLPRHDNYLWEQLAADELYASFIVDGHHLPPPVVRAMVRAKGLERSILCSDAIFAAGQPPGQYEFGGHSIEVLPSGRVSLSGTPYLAGSSLALADAVANAAAYCRLQLADAWRMASDIPARLVGIAGRADGLRVGAPADVTSFSLEDSGRIRVWEVSVGG